MRRSALMLLSSWLIASTSSAATLLVLNKEDATLSFINPTTGATLGTVPTGQGPHEVEVTADGRTAVVTNYGPGSAAGNSLSVVDVATRKERTRVDLGEMRRPHGLAVVGQQAFFTAEDAQQVGMLDIAGGRVTWRHATGQERTHMVVASRDGRTLFTTNMGSDNIAIVTRGDDAATQTLVSVGDAPEGIDLSPDGGQVWVANSAGGSVSVVAVSSRALLKTFDIGTQRSNRLKFTPDGKTVLVSDLTAGQLVVIDVATQEVTKRIPVGRGASGILVVPDGSRAYVAAASERKLVVVDLATLAVTGQVTTGGGPDGMAWIP